MTDLPHVAGQGCLRCEGLLWAVWKLCDPVHQSDQPPPHCLWADLPQHSCATRVMQVDYIAKATLFVVFASYAHAIGSLSGGFRATAVMRYCSGQEATVLQKYNMCSLPSHDVHHTSRLKGNRESATCPFILGSPQDLSHMLTWSCRL